MSGYSCRLESMAWSSNLLTLITTQGVVRHTCLRLLPMKVCTLSATPGFPCIQSFVLFLKRSAKEHVDINGENFWIISKPLRFQFYYLRVYFSWFFGAALLKFDPKWTCNLEIVINDHDPMLACRIPESKKLLLLQLMWRANSGHREPPQYNMFLQSLFYDHVTDAISLSYFLMG